MQRYTLIASNPENFILPCHFRKMLKIAKIGQDFIRLEDAK